MDHPKDKGDRSTLAIMLALHSAGYAVLLPFGENTRYDLVIDDGDVLERVQCKTGRLRGGTVQFATTSTYGHHRNPATHRRNYKGQVDYFAVYCPDNGGIYLIPAEEVPNESQATLRIDPPRNNQIKHVRFARDYELANLPCVDPARVPPRRRQLRLVAKPAQQT